MKKLRVAISSPHEKNLYSLLITKICLDDPDVELIGVCCLKVFSLKRILFELKRLGPRLVQKILDKYLYQPQASSLDSNFKLIEDYNLNEGSLGVMCKNSNINFCKISDPNDADSIEFLSSRKPDVIISIGSIILRDAFISIPALNTSRIQERIWFHPWNILFLEI